MLRFQFQIARAEQAATAKLRKIAVRLVEASTFRRLCHFTLQFNLAKKLGNFKFSFRNSNEKHGSRHFPKRTK